MHSIEETIQRLRAIPKLQLSEDEPLSRHTRFGIGGSARCYAEAPDERSLMEALQVVRQSGAPLVVIGGGTNLIVADAGFDGIVLRLTTREIRRSGLCICAAAGGDLQSLVDFTVENGLRGLETMTGIPGSTGAAIYGNAGAYGHSIEERVHQVRYFDGEEIRSLDGPACAFHYRESIFKRRKDWVILSVDLHMIEGAAEELRATADGILKIRNEKYPPTMKCAGSIFKNLFLADLPSSARGQIPEKVIREGKVPSAYFLEQVGAKGMKNGDIHVADYHANLIYNAGNGTARELREVIAGLKFRVLARYGFELEEEVQYVGFG